MDKSGVKDLLAKRKAQRREEERHKQAVNAAMLMRQAASRFRSARRLAASEPERAAKLREEAEERLTSLARGAGDAWPWTSVMYAFREVDGLVPSDGSAPVFEGMRVVQRVRDGETLAYEFGRVRERTSGAVIGMRRAGESHWSLVGTAEVQELGIVPDDLQRGDDWPADDDAGTDAALTRAIARMNSWTNLGWEGASEAFVGRWWGRRGSAIAEQLARRGVEDERLPVLIDGELRLKSGPAIRDGELLPPTAEGWARYLQLAPLSDEVWTALRDVGDRWWGRRIPRDLLRNVPEIDDETALVRLQRKLREAREAHAIGPRELVEWFDDNDFGKAAEALEAYLDRPTKALAEFAGELRKLIDDELDDRWHSISALTPEGRPNLREGMLLEEAGRSYVLVRAPGGPTRRVYVDAPEVAGAPFTIAEGDLKSRDRLWDLDPGDAEGVEEVWSRYTKLVRALELVPALLGEAHDLLGIATEAIESPKCLGDQRGRAIKALRTAEKYYLRAGNRIHAGRPAAVLDALVQMVKHVSRSAVAVAEACGVGQLEFLGSGPLVVPERERMTLEDLGEDIVDDEDTLDGLEEADAEGEPDVEEDAEPTADEQEHTVDAADLASAAE